MIDALASMSPGGHDVGKLIDEITHDLKTFADATSAQGLPVFSKAPQLYKRFENACRKTKQPVPPGLNEYIEQAKKEYNIHKN
jgi:hypothetical protein